MAQSTFVDWQNPIIGHMQHNLRDPNRDKVHGRVLSSYLERQRAVDARGSVQV